MTETLGALQAPSPSLLTTARDHPRPSFWQWLLAAIMTGRQRKADEFFADFCSATSTSVTTSCVPQSSSVSRIKTDNLAGSIAGTGQPELSLSRR